MSDLIDRQAAINALERTKRIASHELHGGEVLRTFNVVLNSLINIMSLLPPANCSEFPNSSDTISRAKTKEALMNALNDVGVLDAEDINTVFQMLPSAQPAIVPCNYVEACNVATMDKPISAYTYLSVLADLKDHGFVLVDMREVTT